MPNYIFIVADEECPGCRRDTSEQDAVRFEYVDPDGNRGWTTASANAPCGAVTEDELGENDPADGDAAR